MLQSLIQSFFFFCHEDVLVEKARGRRQNMSRRWSCGAVYSSTLPHSAMVLLLLQGNIIKKLYSVGCKRVAGIGAQLESFICKCHWHLWECNTWAYAAGLQFSCYS